PFDGSFGDQECMPGQGRPIFCGTSRERNCRRVCCAGRPEDRMSIHIAIVGNGEPGHVGHHLNKTGRNLGFAVSLLDGVSTFGAPWFSEKWSWWIRGRRPAQLEAFAERLLDQLQQEHPQILIATGIAPLSEEAVGKIHDMGIITMNYLTDDPWNPSHRSSWFL